MNCAASGSSAYGALFGVCSKDHTSRAETLGFGSRTHDRRAQELLGGTVEPAPRFSVPPPADVSQGKGELVDHGELAVQEQSLALTIAEADEVLAASAARRGALRKPDPPVDGAPSDSKVAALLASSASRLQDVTAALTAAEAELSAVHGDRDGLQTEVEALRKMLVSRSTLISMGMPTASRAHKHKLQRGESRSERKLSEGTYRDAANALRRSWSSASVPVLATNPLAAATAATAAISPGAPRSTTQLANPHTQHQQQQPAGAGGGAQTSSRLALQWPTPGTASTPTLPLSSRPGSAGRLNSGRAHLPTDSQLAIEQLENRTIVAMKAQINRMSSEISRW